MASGQPAHAFVRRRQPGENFILFGFRWLRLKYFQYEITVGSYCFTWWEKIVVNLILGGIVAVSIWMTSKIALELAEVLTPLVRQWAAVNGSQ